jgi:hypothetical protein
LSVFLTIAGLLAFATVVCLLVSMWAMKFFFGGVMETLVFFGIAERPVQARKRRLLDEYEYPAAQPAAAVHPAQAA